MRVHHLRGCGGLWGDGRFVSAACFALPAGGAQGRFLIAAGLGSGRVERDEFCLLFHGPVSKASKAVWFAAVLG